MINEEKDIIRSAEKTLVLVLNIIRKGAFEKKKDAFIIRKEGIQNYMIQINEKSLELRIVTMRWVKGNYEPIKSSEVIRSIDHNELENLSPQEKNERITSTLRELM